MYYLDITQHEKTGHITGISRIEEEKYVWLDRFTIRNLELFTSPFQGARTLIDIIDRATSPMGGRLLKKWIALPLKTKDSITGRHDTVEYIVNNAGFRENIQEQIAQIGDLERLVSKIATGRIHPREIVQLKRALQVVVPVKEQCGKAECQALNQLSSRLKLCEEAVKKIDGEINDDPPVMISKGNVISEGISEELDELREILHSGKDYLVDLQARESKNTGIPSLKVGFNNVLDQKTNPGKCREIHYGRTEGI